MYLNVSFWGEEEEEKAADEKGAKRERESDGVETELYKTRLCMFHSGHARFYRP